MAVEVSEEALPFLALTEINDQHAAQRFQYAPDLPYALLPRDARQMMEHQCAEDDVERRVGEGQSLCDAHLEPDLDACPGGFRARSRDHVGRRVDASHGSRPDLTLGRNDKASSAAAHIEHRFTGCETRQAGQLFAKGTVASMREEPDEPVVARGPMQHVSGSRGCVL